MRKVITALFLIVCLATADVAVFASNDPAVDDQISPDGIAFSEKETEAATETETEATPVEQLAPSFSMRSTSGSKGSESTQEKLPAIKRFKFSGWDTTFKDRVDRNAWLSLDTRPTYLKMTAKRKSIKLTWKRPKAIGSIDGLIVLKKTGKSKRYYELKRLPKDATSFVDKKAKKKNTRYAYRVVGYKKGPVIRITEYATPWVLGCTTRSKKKNLYKTRITNVKAISTVSLGSAAKAKAKVPKKTFHKYLRWYSSNKKVATISDSGIIKALAVGTTKITVRTATGRLTSTTIKVVKPVANPQIVQVMKGWVGVKEGTKAHKKIIDTYNSYLPRPRGYKMKYTDAWCDACVSAASILSGNAEATGRECGVPSHITIFKNKGIWIEDGTITPRAGDIIVFAWGKSKQPNNASGSHIGIVEKVSGGKITTIEGNYSDMVKRRTIKVGYGYIRGFARPNYVK